jgi:hypothetical protein
MIGLSGVAASSIPRPPPVTWSDGSEITKRVDCETVGDGDLYGLGVRLGLYLQWASGFILRILGSWETVSRVRTVNNALCSALAVAAAANLSGGSALLVDYLLSFYLTVVLFYAESYNLVVERPNQDLEYEEGREVIYKLYPNIPLIFQNILFASYTLFGAWFWQSGLHKARSPICQEKAAIVLLFDLRNVHWTIAATFLSTVTGAIFASILLIHLLGLRKGINNGPVLAAAQLMQMVSGSFPSWTDLHAGLAPLLNPKARKLRGQNSLKIIRQLLHFGLMPRHSHYIG